MPPQQLFLLRILWAAILMSTVLFLVAGMLVVPQQAGAPPFLLPALAAVSVPIAVASIVWPRRMLRANLRQPALAVEEVPAKERLFADRPVRTRRFTDVKAARVRLGAAAMTPHILGLALAEAVATYGLVLLVMGFGLYAAAPFFVGGWILIGIRFPRPRTFERELEAAYDAELR